MLRSVTALATLRSLADGLAGIVCAGPAQRTAALACVHSLQAEHVLSALCGANQPSDPGPTHRIPRTHGSHTQAFASAAAPQLDEGPFQSPSQLPASVHLTPALFRRLDRMAARFDQLGTLMGGDEGGGDLPPDALRGTQDIASLAREYSRLQPVVELYHQYRGTHKELRDLDSLSSDPDPGVASMAREEKSTCAAKLRSLEESLLLGLLPLGQGNIRGTAPGATSDEERGAVLEVRAGAGGTEASLFAGELVAMYRRFAEARGWSFELLESSSSEMGGLRSASACITGPGAYERMRHEAGVHRVQRVPATEMAGRLHTSTAAVVVLPEADEVEVVVHEEDLKVETYRSQGAGGQHVNTTSSAVRITHLPTGIIASSQDERSQIRNRMQALRVLRARLLEQQRRAAGEAASAARRSQVTSAERNERVRTYNFQQDRLTDHRVGITHHGLDEVMAGSCPGPLDSVHEALAAQERAEALRDLVEGEEEQDQEEDKG